VASLLIRGFAFGFAIAASPGPIFFLCLRRSLLRGWPAGVASGLGVATADGVYAAIAVSGIAVVAGAVEGAGRWLQLAGGLALAVLGITAVLGRSRKDEPQPAASKAGLAWAYASTLGLTIANPATIIAFVALAAALSAGLSGGLGRPAVVVAGVALGSAAWWLLLAGVAAALRARITPAVVNIIGRLSGLAIFGLGLLTLVTAAAK
jgi:threonine/homoserine/homoserine lactone efflux protein